MVWVDKIKYNVDDIYNVLEIEYFIFCSYIYLSFYLIDLGGYLLFCRCGCVFLL